MADSLDSGSSVHYGRAGSSPASRTTFHRRAPFRWNTPTGRYREQSSYRRASGGIGRLARFRFWCPLRTCGFKSRLAHQRERASYPEVLSLWAPAAEGGPRPSVIQMLGGSEFRLRRGFIYGKAPVRRKCAAGQKAGGVGLLYLFEILKYRF